MRVAIVGGGIIGCSTALALRAKRAEVLLFDSGALGHEASGAAAGILGAQIEAYEGSPILDRCVRARAAYGEWARELFEATSIDIGYRKSGLLKVARTNDEASIVADDIAFQSRYGLRVERVGPADARRIEPELGEDVLVAAYFPDEAQVDPRALVRALAGAVNRAGVAVHAGTRVERLVIEKGACAGVVSELGETRADAVVLAAGSWSTSLPGVPPSVPTVRPVRGQVVELEESPARVRTMIYGAGAYLLPRGDGRVYCGSTLEFAGYRREVTAGGVHSILGGVVACIPRLAEARIRDTWCGFRPYAGDRTDLVRFHHGAAGAIPLVGRSTLPGLFLATAHHRNGILLAKETGDMLADEVTR